MNNSKLIRQNLIESPFRIITVKKGKLIIFCFFSISIEVYLCINSKRIKDQAKAKISY